MTRALAKNNELQVLAEKWIKLTDECIKLSKKIDAQLKETNDLQMDLSDRRVQVGQVQNDLQNRVFTTEDVYEKPRAVQTFDGPILLLYKNKKCQMLEVVK